MERHRPHDNEDHPYEHEPGVSTEGLPQPEEQPGGQEQAPERPTVFLADYGAYAAEVNRGRWIDASLDADVLQRAADQLLATSPFPNATVGVRHWHGFAGIRLNGHEDYATISRLAHGVLDHGRAFAAFADMMGNEDAGEDGFRAYYLGSWPDLTSWAEYMASELDWQERLDAAAHAISPMLASVVRIDFQRLGHDLRHGVYVHEDEEAGQLHLFRLQL